MKNFKTQIQKNKIVSPNKRGFNPQDWHNEFERIEEKDRGVFDSGLKEAGLFFYELFEACRKNKETLYKKTPSKLTNKKLIEFLCAFSNEQLTVVNQKFLQSVESKQSFENASVASDSSDNEFSFIQAREGGVNAIELALKECMRREKKHKELPLAEESSFSIFEFLHYEHLISEMYSVLESYWNALVYSDHLFHKSGDSNYIIQWPTDSEIAIEHYYARKERIARQEISIYAPIIEKMVKRDLFYIHYEKRKFVRRKLFDNEALKSLYFGLEVNYMHSWDDFPQDELNIQRKKGFSVYEVFQVFRMLALLASDAQKKHSKASSNTSEFYTENELLSFFPRYSRHELIKALSNVLKLEYRKIILIFEFLTFSNDPKCDIWDHPIISLPNNKIGLIWAPLLYANIWRLIEEWMAHLSVDLAAKGTVFEKMIVQNVNEALKLSNMIAENDYEEAIGKKVTIKEASRNEEIDLIFRIGALIVLGEVKSIVTPDSVIRNFNALDAIKHGVEQIIRKEKFIQLNLKDIFKALNWNYDENIEYEVVGCVITNNGLHSGFPIDNVPICDSRILTKYIKTPEFELLSSPEKGDIAWYELYSSFDEMQKNFKKYLIHPPQILTNTDRKNRFEVKTNTSFIPSLTLVNLKARVLTLEEIIKGTTSNFPLKTIENIEGYLKEENFLIM